MDLFSQTYVTTFDLLLVFGNFLGNDVLLLYYIFFLLPQVLCRVVLVLKLRFYQRCILRSFDLHFKKIGLFGGGKGRELVRN